MALRGADVVERTLKVAVSELTGPAAQAKFAAFAKERLHEVIAAGIASPRYEKFVNGREGAAEESIRLPGAIIYQFQYLGEIAAFALEELKKRAPRGDGEKDRPYHENFYLGLSKEAGGSFRFVPEENFNPDAVTNAIAEIAIGNRAPYSRKVDVQRTGNKPIKFSVAPNLFADVAALINSRYGNSVTCKRVYSFDFPNQWKIKQTQTRKGTNGRVKRLAGTLVESPAIVFSLR